MIGASAFIIAQHMDGFPFGQAVTFRDQHDIDFDIEFANNHDNTNGAIDMPAHILPPNHCSHVVKYYEHRAKTAPQPVAWEIAPWILFDRRAQLYANTMMFPGRFNII